VTLRAAAPAAQVARVVHTGLLIAVVVTALVLMGVRVAVDGRVSAAAVIVLRIVAAFVLVVVATGVQLVKARLPRVGSEADPGLWWVSALPRAIAVWALAEGATVIGGVLWLVSGDVALFVVLLGAGLVVLALNRPGRLEAG
jgi:hypothetical protein